MKIKLPVKLTQTIGKAGFALKEASPKLLIFGGVGVLIAAGVVACKETLAVEGIIDEHLEELGKINEALENESKVVLKEGEEPVVYTKELATRDKAHLVARTGFKVVKNYLLAILLVGVGAGMIFGGTKILDGRFAAATATAAMFEEKYKNSVDWVRDEYGEEAAKRAATAKKKTETVEETDENGNVSTVEKETWEYGTPYGDYEILWDEYTAPMKWDKNDFYNRQYIENVEYTVNNRLRDKGHVFLSEVYDLLGIERTPASIVCGWLDNPNVPRDENQIRFIFREERNREFSAFDSRPAHWIDFNCDGVIWDKINRRKK